ncbi:MAG: polyprenyl synthetase family protein [Clostridiales Family XIII bacterium]|jgi:geranylgeranyl pyrophosphate synthase|nr:polyprenyl synthetase family protein [Clostridiales Family XIII bacterium]
MNYTDSTTAYYEAFRRLHSERSLAARPEASILLGDYFFSLFAKSLLAENRTDEAAEIAKRLQAEITELIDEDRMKADVSRILSAGGKGLRTKLARICYDVGRRYAAGGAEHNEKELEPLLEVLDMLHNASLIHDDAVDDAELRRGQPTINRTSGVFAAVQSGDWLLAETMGRVAGYREVEIDEILTLVPLAMCEGELLQQRMRFRLSLQTTQRYFRLIGCKTAALFAASCRAGALAAGAPANVVGALDRFGRLFGIAFQIRDDVLDFCREKETGKKYAQDIRNGIFTLPVLLAAGYMPPPITALLEKKQKSERDVDDIVAWVESTDSLDRAMRESGKLFSEAEDVLDGIGRSKYTRKLSEVVGEVCAAG